MKLDMALFKKGKKPMGKKKRNDGPYGQMAEGYNDMMTPRNEQMMQNMERVDEDQEEDLAGHEESHQQMAGQAPEGEIAGE